MLVNYYKISFRKSPISAEPIQLVVIYTILNSKIRILVLWIH